LNSLLVLNCVAGKDGRSRPLVAWKADIATTGFAAGFANARFPSNSCVTEALAVACPRFAVASIQPARALSQAFQSNAFAFASVPNPIALLPKYLKVVFEFECNFLVPYYQTSTRVLPRIGAREPGVRMANDRALLVVAMALLIASTVMAIKALIAI
jgi:hypothetical protein